MKAIIELREELGRIAPEMPLADEQLSRCTSFRIGGGSAIARPRSSRELGACLAAARELGVPAFVLGNGTNVLADDEGFGGLVVSTSGLTAVTADGEAGTVTAECGASLARTALAACTAGLAGFEFAHGIPGSVGGAVAMNAGAYGGAISDVLASSLRLDQDGKAEPVPRDAHKFGYRHSVYTELGGTALSAVFALEHGDKDEIKAKMDELMRRRRASQPLDWPSAGSVFKRPEGYFAGKLIEDCGLKGFRIGGAAVSEKHAGFIVNLGGATASDVRRLVEHIKQCVLRAYGVSLECEIRRLAYEGECAL